MQLGVMEVVISALDKKFQKLAQLPWKLSALEKTISNLFSCRFYKKLGYPDTNLEWGSGTKMGENEKSDLVRSNTRLHGTSTPECPRHF